MKDGNLHIETETAPQPEITYTEEVSAAKVSGETSNTLTEKEAATEPFKRCLNVVAAVFALILIILIVLKWQKTKQDP